VFNSGGTATLTGTRVGDGGTVCAFTVLTAPFQRALRPLVTSTTRTAVGYDPGTSVSGTVFVYYDRDRAG
jgi:hypothetical protein